MQLIQKASCCLCKQMLANFNVASGLDVLNTNSADSASVAFI